MRQFLSTLSTKVKTSMMVLTILTAQVAGAVAPFMPTVHADPAGNNGTLQVHEQGEPDFKRNTDPHVCDFNFEVFGVDGNQTGNVTITPQSPTNSNGTPDGNPLVLPLSTNASGDGATAYVNDAASTYSLRDGHYKATLDNKFGTDPGDKAKSKVFWVDCPDIAPTLSTTASSSTIVSGSAVHDTATLTGDFNHGTVTGSVKFYVCGPAASAPDCTSGGTQVGNSVNVVNGSASSANISPTATGTYCFRAVYTPSYNSNYLSVAHTNKTTECFTVTPKNGTITVTKVVNNTHGGKAVVSDFPLFVNTTQVTSGATTSYASGQQYTVTENGGPTGYTQTSAVCVDSYTNQSVGTTFTLGANENVTCTITNTDNAPLLTVTKHVLNTHGGTMMASDFTLHVNSYQLLPQDAKKGGGTVADNSVTYEYPNALANTAYNVSEDTAKGYAQQSIVCTDYNTKATVAQPVVLQPGQQVDCTITNNDIAPKLTVIKHVVNTYGGKALASDFLMGVTGTNVSNSSFAGSETGTLITLDAGSYSVGESGGPSGYTGSSSADCSGTLSVGDDKTCTITNSDQPVSISGHKYDVASNATPGSGGTPIQNWTVYLLINGSPITHTTTTDANGNYSFTGLNWGNYTLAECQNAADGCTGWTQVYGPGAVSVDGNNLSSTNNDFGNHASGTIKVVKNVDTNGDGNVDVYGSTDWNWDINGSGKYVTGTTQTVDSHVNGVSYAVSEEGQTDYHFTAVTCTDNGQNISVAQDTSVDVTVNPGDNVVCTFTNTRDTGTVSVTKYLYPDTDTGLFNLLVDGSVEATNVGDGGTTGDIRVLTGTHSVSELAGTATNLGDYDSWYYCTDGGHGLYMYDSGTSTPDFTVTSGEQVHCYFYNTRHATITVVKNVDDGLGNVTQDVTDWNWDINGTGNFTTGSTNPQAVSAYDTYTVSEQQKTGYHVTASSCDGGVQDEEDVPALVSATSVVASPSTSLTVYAHAGEHITCTFTNTRDTAKLTIIKKAYPVNSSQAFTFDLKQTVSSSLLSNLSGLTSKTFQLDDNTDPALSNTSVNTLATGTYSVTEESTAGWNLADLTCDSKNVTINGATLTAALAAGDDVTCTYTNQKHVVPQVLGASTVKTLTNTGLPVIAYTVIAFTLIGTALYVTKRREA